MKTLLVCSLFIGLALTKPAGDDGGGCGYTGYSIDEGRCTMTCPVGTHAYLPGPTGCSYYTPEATCTNPEPKQDTQGMLCDFSACYCDAPTVRDKKTYQCVTVDKCTK